MIKTLGFTAAAVVGVASSAFAADLPSRAYAPAVVAPVAYNWTGLYAGLNAGYGFSARNNTVVSASPAVFPTLGVTRPGSTRLDPDGFIGGGQIGYNWQFGSFVAGVETDIAYTDFRDTRNVVLGGLSSQFRQRIDYLGTVRARLGVAFDRALIYATGGLAYGDVRNSATFYNGAGVATYTGSSNKTRAGYTIGGGIEYAITNTISVRGEYLYYNLGRRTIGIDPTLAAAAPVGVYAARFRNDGHIIRAGLNFKF